MRVVPGPRLKRVRWTPGLGFWFNDFAMIFLTHIPGPPLSDFVDVFWFYEGGVIPHAKERVLPSGCIELVINLREDSFRVYDRRDHDKFQNFRGCLISGPHSEFTVIDRALPD